MTSILGSLLENLSPGAVFFLMLLESTVFPVPSELVVSPAVYAAADSGLPSVLWIILVGTLGADCGASINYVASYYLGRPVIYRFANSRLGRLCLLNQEKLEKAERYFDSHGATATLTGRLVPVIRHLISIPAGLSRMNYWRFLLFTTIGAGVWNCILAALGWYLHSIVPQDMLNDKIEEYSEYIKFIILGALIVAIAYVLIRKYAGKRQ